MVLAVSDALRGALAAADGSRIGEAARLWVRERAADGEAFDHEIATDILGAPARLAGDAVVRDHHLYCWIA